jgi:sugar lactone lactonase YvrE
MVMSAAAAAWAGEAEATHQGGKSIAMADLSKGGRLASFCLSAEGNILACDSGSKAVLVASPEGKLLAQWPLEWAPQAVHAHDENAVYVGGQGRVARLDKAGKVVKTAELPSGETRVGNVAAIATTDKDVFVAANVGFGFSVFRFDHDLAEPKEVVSRLRGCCGQMNIAAKDGALYAAENARKRVVRFDRDGKELGSWGKDSRTDVEGFGSCCNPMNICFGPDGDLYTSESQGRVKRYTPDGKFLSLVGLPTIGGSCLNVTVAVNKDASRVLVLDTQANLIRVLAKK